MLVGGAVGVLVLTTGVIVGTSVILVPVAGASVVFPTRGAAVGVCVELDSAIVGEDVGIAGISVAFAVGARVGVELGDVVF